MKRHGNLYNQISDIDNIENAYRRTRIGKRYDAEAMRFHYNAYDHIISIYNDLAWRRYNVGRYREFVIKDPKERLIQYLPLRDRIVQQALHQIIEPIYDRGFIDDSYACRKGMGTHRAMRRLQYFVRAAEQRWPDGEIYYLHCDVHKYFLHIDHDVLYDLMARKIKCLDTLRLIRSIIDSSTSSPGLPIGSLFSQLSANVYLDVVDQFVKHTLRERFYLRYMDNFIIIHHDKRHLLLVKNEIEDVLVNRLRLTFNPTMTRIDTAKTGVEFVGYRVYADRIKIKKATTTRMKKRLREMQAMYRLGRMSLDDITKRIRSWLGHCKHASASALTRKILDGAVFSMDGNQIYIDCVKLIR
jgi:retron-type reverse transcriptase